MSKKPFFYRTICSNMRILCGTKKEHLVWTITSRPNCCGYLIIFVKIMRFRVTQLRKRLH